MTRWTQEELDEYMKKHPIKPGMMIPVNNIHDLDGLKFPILDELVDEGPESELQRKIVKWAKDNGHPILSFKQSKQARGFIPEGYPDITLILPDRVLFIELKSGKGRLSEGQKQMKIQFLNHKHLIWEIRSYQGFLNLIGGY